MGGAGGGKKKTTKQRLTWSRLAFTPLAAHQNFDNLDVSVEAGFAAAEQTGGAERERVFRQKSPVVVVVVVRPPGCLTGGPVVPAPVTAPI